MQMEPPRAGEEYYSTLEYYSCSWNRIELISMVMQATNPVHFLENTSAVIAS